MKKLKSRKFWIAVATAAYFGGMAIKEQGTDSATATVVYAVCMLAVVFGYLVVEGFLDDAGMGEQSEEIEEGKEGEKA